MIRFTTDELARAAESLSYQQVTSEGISRGVNLLPDSSIVKLASTMQAVNMGRKQFETADRLGRELAKKAAVAGGGPISKVLGATLKGLQKSVGLERIRGAAKPYSRKVTGLRKVKGKKKKVPFTRTQKFEPGLASFKERWRDQPVQVAKGVVKDIAPLAGVGYLGAKALGGRRRD